MFRHSDRKLEVKPFAYNGQKSQFLSLVCKTKMYSYEEVSEAYIYRCSRSCEDW